MPTPRRLAATLAAALLTVSCTPGGALAVTTVFFSDLQTTNWVASGTTSDTLATEGYLFTLTRDKLFTGGVGLTNPIGRPLRVSWPNGLEAQAVTTGPSLSGAKIVIARQDGQTFDITSFTAKLLANTAGAGGSFEIMPMLNGEDGVPDPYMFDATGIAGNSFTYATPALTNYDAYKITLYVDYALMSLTVVDASPPPPSLEILSQGGTAIQIAWPTNAVGYTLVAATNLPAISWTQVTNSVAANGEVFTVQIPVAGRQRYFQLRK